MVFWKEWRETRFGFLVTLFFVTGLYYSLPNTSGLIEDYWLSMFLLFFGIGFAIVSGSGALSSEIEGGTLSFLVSQPLLKEKLLAAKFLVRGAEVTLIYCVPTVVELVKDTGPVLFLARILNMASPSIVAHPAFAGVWDDRLQWMWVPPYLAPQYLLLSLLVVVFIFSGTLLLSTIIPRKVLPAISGVILAAAHFSFRGMAILQKVDSLEQVKGDILLLLILIPIMAISGIVLFSRSEY
ncbi:MAG: hypothetical protein C4520_18590 [Candidatus Abyssobacteria bacterium SURF_5]|uniref:Uncharacterized protein n=1 Tax=Abyssobacteria bacterium (strain SURF_5) TaxID=2093360 RepID=A0A3A4N1Z8_ABYX5|nr:MAG: hypothetical protein C4520_18590 [Candidatus Abyssubacteria bacterium SURF_5]